MSVGVVLVGVALVNVVDMTGLIAVVLVGVALMRTVRVVVRMVLVAVTLVDAMDVAEFVPMVFVVVAFINVVLLHRLSLPNGMMDSVGLHARPFQHLISNLMAASEGGRINHDELEWSPMRVRKYRNLLTTISPTPVFAPTGSVGGPCARRRNCSGWFKPE